MKINGFKTVNSKEKALGITSKSITNPFEIEFASEPINEIFSIKKWEENGSAENIQAKWDISKLPLRFYINEAVDDPAFNPEFVSAGEKAFIVWTRASYGLIRFQRIYNISQADITVDWTNDPPPNREMEAGNVKLKVINNKIESAQIKILTSSVFDSMRNVQQKIERVKRTFLHEIGHSLGLEHSNSSKDIMFHKGMNNKSLTNNDITRLNSLYGINTQGLSI